MAFAPGPQRPQRGNPDHPPRRGPLHPRPQPRLPVVIPVTSVSREHARILRVRRPVLHRGHAEPQRHLRQQPGRSPSRTAAQEQRQDPHLRLPSPPSIDAASRCRRPTPGRTKRRRKTKAGPPPSRRRCCHNSSMLLETQPARSCAALLEISGNLSKTLELDPLLPKIVDSLFQLFKQADRCFIILAEESTSRLLPKVIKTRRPQDEDNARFSRSIVRQCLERPSAFLSDDASQRRPHPAQPERRRFPHPLGDVRAAVRRRRQGLRRHPARHAGPQQEVHPGRPQAALGRGQPGVASPWRTPSCTSDSRWHAKRLNRDLELAQQVQLSFLPRDAAEVPGYEFFAHYEPAHEVGGDYYGFIPLAAAGWRSASATWPARACRRALLMAKLSSDALLPADRARLPGSAINKLNDLLYECRPDGPLRHAGRRRPRLRRRTT